METQNLLAFVRVAESGSFSLAAEQLHLTQPAVSKRIAALEDQLSARLFDRVGRQILLTEAGRVLLPRAQQILQSVKEARRHLADLAGEVGGELSVITSHHVGLHRLPPVLKEYVREYPEVDLQLGFVDSERAYGEVLHGAAELAVVTLSPEAPASVVAEVLWEDPLQFVVSPEHPLAGHSSARRSSKHSLKKAQCSLRDLSAYPAILPEPHTYTARIVRDLFAGKGLTLHTKLASNFLETIKMMVSIDLGWSVLPETLIDGQLQVLDVSGIRLKRNLGYIRHRERSMSNAAARFVELLNRRSITK